jgi:hypothetical protein
MRVVLQLVALKSLWHKEFGMTDIQIEALLALADELDAAGYEQDADDMENALKSAVQVPEGAMDLEKNVEQRVILPEYQGDVAELNQKIEAFLQNPTPEGKSGIDAALEKIVQERAANKPAEQKPLSDEEASEQIKNQGGEWGQSNVGQQFQGAHEDVDEAVRRLEESGEESFLIDTLAGIADRLDGIGAIEAADKVDNFIKKCAEENQEDFLNYQGEDKDSEQSKRYDTKHHHDMLVRAPKNDNARVDLEGKENHHVKAQQSSPNNMPLNTRYCPDHIGVSVSRVGENTYQCPLDGKIYNYETGWEDYDGNKHPGGSVAEQTPDASGYGIPHRIFDTRENIINSVN